MIIPATRCCRSCERRSHSPATGSTIRHTLRPGRPTHGSAIARHSRSKASAFSFSSTAASTRNSERRPILASSDPTTRTMQRQQRAARDSRPVQSSFSTRKRAEACTTSRWPTCSPGSTALSHRVFAREFIAPACRRVKGTANSQSPRISFKRVLVGAILSTSFSTTRARHHPGAICRRIRRSRPRAEFPSQRYGSSRSRRADASTRAVAAQRTPVTAIATPPVWALDLPTLTSRALYLPILLALVDIPHAEQQMPNRGHANRRRIKVVRDDQVDCEWAYRHSKRGR